MGKKSTWNYIDREIITAWVTHYDTLGNPLTYYDGTTFTWQGRQLVGAVKGTNTMSFTYNDNGLRTSKTVNGVTTEYYWNGNLLAAEKSPYYLIIYNYDAWGKCTASYYNGGASTSATKNNLCYRSYYYDTDLGLYYLQSRYYDANTCRFINADSYISTGQGILGYNMFAYCGNNPVNYVDYAGDIPGMVMASLYENSSGTRSDFSIINKKWEKALFAANNAHIEVFGEHKITFDRVLIEDFDAITLDIFFYLIYQRSLDMARNTENSTQDLMTLDHIRWETMWHLAVSFLPNTDEINLNFSETKFGMIKRGFKAILGGR